MRVDINGFWCLDFVWKRGDLGGGREWTYRPHTTDQRVQQGEEEIVAANLGFLHYNGFMGKFANSWALFKESWAVLKRTPGLVTFPIISAVVTLAVAAGFFVPYYFLSGGVDLENTPAYIYVPVMFGFYLVTSFVVIFFNSGLVACAYASLQGKPTNVSYGMSEATKRLPAIFGWALLSATVGVVIRLIGEYVPAVGRILESILGFVWGVVTFFVVPVIVIEHGSPVAAVKKSAGLLKKSWGEQIIVGSGLGLATFLLSLIPVPFVVMAVFSGIVPVIVGAVALAVLWWIVLAVVTAALQGVYQTALFVYASTDVKPRAFSSTVYANAFVPKKSTGWHKPPGAM